jgi:long-chain acyl-CoA synthetase
MQSATLYSMYLNAACRFPDQTSLKYKSHGKYVGMSYRELLNHIDTAAANLERLGIRKGNSVGIFSNNRPEWVITDLAACKLGAVVVPIYPSTSASTLEYIVNDSGIKLLVVESASLMKLVMQVEPRAPSLEKILLVESDGISGLPVQIFSEALMKSCETLPGICNADERDVASIVYTSGTTGPPKGVVLTHSNIVSNVQAVMTRFRVTADDVTVSYLPLCHMFERTCGYYAILFGGGSVAYADNIETISQDVTEIRPTVLIAVPRVLEKAFEKSVSAVQQKSWIGQWLVSSAMRNLNRLADVKYKKLKVRRTLRIKCFIENLIVGSNFRHLAGGRLRLIASGGAPLDRKIAKAFHILGFNIVEGYGLTETSPVVCCNSPANNKLGTVGKPLDGVQVKLGENSEVLVKGPNVMRGYLHNHEATHQAIDVEGWFHTGDLGQFDEQGYLKITGRIKDLIVTSYGKNISANSIEEGILGSPFVSQVLVIGDGRKFISALIVPDWKAVNLWASNNGITSADPSSPLEEEALRKLFERAIEETTRDCAPFERPKDFRIIPEEFTIEDGLLTPTMKLRRSAIVEKYRTLIESMYNERKTVNVE